MLETLIVVGGLALFSGAFYLRMILPWPFTYEDRKFRRMRDGSFQDANKTQVSDPALIPELQKAYEAAKYGKPDLQAWGTDNN